MSKSPKTTTAPTGQIAPFGLRMLPELKEKIESAARESGRSMNAEIVARLEQTFKVYADSETRMVGTSFAKPLALDFLGEQIQLELAVASLDSQARISLKKLQKVQAAIAKIESSILNAEAHDDQALLRTLESQLHDEMKWLRELENEYTSTEEELSELKQHLQAARGNSDDRFRLGA